MSTSTTKRRLASLASLSAVIATMVVAAAPTSSLAAGGDVDVRGETLTAKIVNPTGPVTGTINADGFDIAVYFGPGHSGTVDANISGATWYGVVADRASVTVTGSQIHDIGDNPSFSGVQRGRAVLYINGATGTVSDNKVYDFQKNGIEISGQTADGSGLSGVKTSVKVLNNVVTGEGPIDYIAQNGIVIRSGAIATVRGNTVRDFSYTPDGTEATGLLNYEADKVMVSGNTFARTEVPVDGPVMAIRNVRGSYTATTRSHRTRIHFTSEAQPTNTVIGKRLHWVVKVDGRTVVDLRQRFSDHDDYAPYFAAGNHRVQIYKNGDLIRTIFVKA